VGQLAEVYHSLMDCKVYFITALKEGSPTSGSGKRGHGFRNALVIAEIAITLSLAFASGLLIRSLIAAQRVNPGFDPQHLLTIELELPGSRYKRDRKSVV